MSRKRRKGGRPHGSSGRVTPKGTRGGFRPVIAPEPDPFLGNDPFFESDPFFDDLAVEDDPMVHMSEAMRADHPHDLLAIASGMAWVFDPAATSPFDDPDDEPDFELSDLLDGLLATDDLVSTGMLGCFSFLLDDELARRRCAKEVARRNQPVPDWFRALRDARVTRTVRMSEELADGDNVYLELTWPTGHQVVVTCLIDHNMGGVLKDAFTVPDSLDQLLEEVARIGLAPDEFTMTDLDPADTRAELEVAVIGSNITFPRPESDTWPAMQPMLRWALSLLPEGGDVAEPVQWDPAELEAIKAQFLGSDEVAGLVDQAHALLEPLLWYGTDYGNQDPYRWGPVRAEIFLVDWLPRKVIAPADELAPAPDVLAAYVRWAHAQAGIPAQRTAETLEVIDQFRDEFLAAVGDENRPTGPEAMLARLGLLDENGPFGDLVDVLDGMDWDLDDLDDEWDPDEDWQVTSARHHLRYALRAVGSTEALDALDAAELPDEELDLTRVAPDVRERVARVSALCDRVCDEHFVDVELRTACRRLLADVAAGDAAIFRRRSKDETAAAAICWVVAKANDRLPHGATTPMFEVLGVKGSVSQRAEPMLRAIGVESGTFAYWPYLGTPRYLTSERREKIVGWRRRWEELQA